LKRLTLHWNVWHYIETFDITLKRLTLHWNVWHYIETFDITSPAKLLSSTLVDIHGTECYCCSVSELLMKTDSRFVSCECPVCAFRCFHPLFCGNDIRWSQRKPSDSKISWYRFSIWWVHFHINNSLTWYFNPFICMLVCCVVGCSVMNCCRFAVCR